MTENGKIILNKSLIWVLSILTGVFIFISGFVYAGVRENNDCIQDVKGDLYRNYITRDQLNDRLLTIEKNQDEMQLDIKTLLRRSGP